MRVGIALAGFSTILAVSAAQTAGPVEKQGRYWVQTEEGSLPAGGRLRVSSTGSITVSGESASQEVRYRVLKRLRAGSEQDARRFLEQAGLKAERQGTTAVLALSDPDCGRCGFTAEMTIQTPRSTQQTDLQTRGGPLTVNDLAGQVNAETAGGSISMDGIGGALQAQTAGGSIALGSIGGAVKCETAGGSISLDRGGADAELATHGGSITAGDVAGMLRAETAGGSIRVQKVGGRVVAGTSGGSIHLGEVGGPVEAETAGGSIHVGSAPQGVRAETAGGGIELNDVAGAVRAANAAGSIRAQFLAGRPVLDSSLETNVGNIVVWIPADLALSVDASVELGNSLNKIESEFSSIKVTRSGSDFGPGTVTAIGAINGGGPVLRIRNTTGRIEIRKRQ